MGWVERIGVDHHFVILDFEVDAAAEQPLAGDDADEARWVAISALADHRSWTGSRTSSATVA